MEVESLDKKKSAAELKKVPDKKNQVKEVEEEKKKPELTEKDLILKTQKMKMQTANPVIERAVYIFRYKNRDFLRLLQATIIDINLDGLKIANGSERDIRTRKLTESEKKDLTLDYIGGVEFIDKHWRIFILEGLGKGGMCQLEARINKSAPNNSQFKIMKDSTILFDQRLYSDFDVDVKRIKLRTPLKSLILMPNLFLREKVPLEIYEIIIKLTKLLEKETVHEVVTSNLWPDIKSIINFERNYGEALNDDDYFGKESKRRRVNKPGTEKQGSTHNSGFASEITSVVSMEDLRTSRKLGNRHVS